MEITFLLIVEIIGTLAFAISGIRLAALKKFDWFGAFIVGLVTAIGGGTIRDLFLSTTPFWMLISLLQLLHSDLLSYSNAISCDSTTHSSFSTPLGLLFLW